MSRHQIVLIGRQLDTALIGVKEFHPDVLHLLYTPITADKYQPLISLIQEHSNPAAHIESQVFEYLTDPYDSKQVQEICRNIRESLEDGDSLQYNLTEGTKVAAFAALDVAREFGDDAVYYSQEGEVIDLMGFFREKVSAHISNQEFFRLFGNPYFSFNVAEEILPVDVVTAWDVKRFIEKHQKTYQRIQKQYRSEFGGRIEKLPSDFKVEREHNMFVNCKGGGLRITDRGKVIFENSNPLSVRLFFTGRWWETIVSNLVYKWDVKRHSNPDDCQVWRNIEFRTSESGQTKNELDVLVNDRRRLIMLECKSGYIAQENVYKIDSTRETYGGNHSKGILVSYYPLDEALARKCRDLHVYYFAPDKDGQRVDYINGLPSFLDKVVKEVE